MISNSAAGAGASLSVSNNNFQGITYNVASSGAMTFISNTALTPTTFNYNANTFTNLTLNTTGSVTFFGAGGTLPSTTVMNMNNNSIVTQFTKSGAGGTIAIRTTASSTPAGAVMNFQNNNFSNITFSGATTFSGYNDNDGGAPTKVITGNTISNINGGTSAITALFAAFNGTGTNVSNNIVGPITGQGAITGISVGGSGTSTTQTVSNNTVTGLSSTGAGGAVIGITVAATASVGTTVSNNTITSLSSTSGNVTGDRKSVV